jgi:hypothetical protein
MAIEITNITFGDGLHQSTSRISRWERPPAKAAWKWDYPSWRSACASICVHIPCNTCNNCIYIYHIQIHLGGLLPASETEFRSSKFYPLPIINSTSPSNFFSFPPTPQTPHSSPRCHHRSIHHEAQELLLQGLLRRPLQIPIAGWQRHVAAPSTG